MEEASAGRYVIRSNDDGMIRKEQKGTILERFSRRVRNSGLVPSQTKYRDYDNVFLFRHNPHLTSACMSVSRSPSMIPILAIAYFNLQMTNEIVRNVPGMLHPFRCCCIFLTGRKPVRIPQHRLNPARNTLTATLPFDLSLHHRLSFPWASSWSCVGQRQH